MTSRIARTFHTESDDVTSIVARRYDRIARAYDLAGGADLLLTAGWRRALWSSVEDVRVLEVGVGTGLNFGFHPAGLAVTGIDIAPKMLAAARRRAARLEAPVRLELGDVQALRFPNASFDTVVATFVFCSVPDALRGLRELRRVLRPGGRLLLLEHVISSRPWLAALMRVLDPLTVRMSGAHIARNTVGNVELAGFVDVVARPLLFDVVQHIEARAPARSS